MCAYLCSGERFTDSKSILFCITLHFLIWWIVSLLNGTKTGYVLKQLHYSPSVDPYELFCHKWKLDTKSSDESVKTILQIAWNYRAACGCDGICNISMIQLKATSDGCIWYIRKVTLYFSVSGNSNICK